MRDLITLQESSQLAYEQLAEVQILDDYYTAVGNLPKNTRAADLVRARLGLPTREP